MPSLPELKTRFPQANFTYPPTPGCPRCSGTGVKPARRSDSGRIMAGGPCACLFFGPNTELAMGLLRNAARRALKKLADG